MPLRGCNSIVRNRRNGQTPVGRPRSASATARNLKKIDRRYRKRGYQGRGPWLFSRQLRQVRQRSRYSRNWRLIPIGFSIWIHYADMPLPHLILVPGLVCDHDAWKHQAESLRALATVDIADHGLNDSLENMAETLLRRAPLRFALAGHSMGGRVAFEVLRRAPDRVIGLAALDTAYLPRSMDCAGEREQAERHSLLEKARSEGMRAMGLQWVQKMVHPERLSDSVLIEAILNMIARKTPEIFAA